MPEYFKGLDSLRFYAFLIVFVSHVFTGFTLNRVWFPYISSHINIGDLGVTFFFVLSGFLITTLLFREKEKTKTINIRNFYIRRVKRIWPVYYFVLFFKFIIVPSVIVGLSYLGIHLSTISGDSWHTLPWFIFFIFNLYISYFGFLSPILNVLWSISVEEQFYILWPWVISYLERYFYFLVIPIIFLSIYFKYSYYGLPAENFHTLSVFGSLAVGALGSYWCVKSKKFISYFNTPKIYLSIFLYLSIILTVILRIFREEVFGNNILMASVLYTVSCFIFLFFILEQSLSLRPLLFFGRFKILNYLGKISYGLYAYHMIAFTLVITYFKIIKIDTRENLAFYILGILSTFVLTILISIVSHKYIEKPILEKSI